MPAASGSKIVGIELSSSGLPELGAEIKEYTQGKLLCGNDKGVNTELYRQVWLSSAGPLANVPRPGDTIYYFPQGHVEQVVALMKQEAEVEMPIYNIPPKVLCKVVSVHLQAEDITDEVFAKITLLPEKEPSPVGVISPAMPKKSNILYFCKKLTPSDTSTHGGFSIPKRYADKCFPPLDISAGTPAQSLVAKDLHGRPWHFRHIYRGQPKRHLITSGWSSFVTAKNLVAGDECIFARGEKNELYVGFRRAKTPQYTPLAYILSIDSMLHGILSSAYHSISTGSPFSVCYRPWTCPAEFMVSHELYLKSTENGLSSGTKFKMHFRSEECPEHERPKIEGTVIGNEDINCIRWPYSEWRSVKVKWDAAESPFSERISPWNIECIGTKKLKSIDNSQLKRARPLHPSSPFLTKNVEPTSRRQLGVLQGQEIIVAGAEEQGASTLSTLAIHNQLTSWIQEPFSLHPGSPILVAGGNPRNSGLAKTCGTDSSIGASTFFNTGKDNSSQESNAAFEEKEEVPAKEVQPTDSCKFMLFGVDIKSPQMGISAAINVVHSSKNIISGNLQDQPWKNCSCFTSRTYTKVLKYGTALGRSVDLSCFNGYNDLITVLDEMFEFKGMLIDGSSGWNVIYTDSEGDIMLLGDNPWQEFRIMVRKIFIYPKKDLVGKVPPCFTT